MGKIQIFFQQVLKKVRARADTTTQEAVYSNMVNDITKGVANMMSDTETTPEAINFLQTLSSSVTKNQNN